MSLADACMDAISLLTAELAEVLADEDNLSKPTNYLAKVVEASFHLAECALPAVLPPSAPDEMKTAVINRAVIANVLSHANAQNEDTICAMIVKTMQNSARMREGIEQLHAKFFAADALFDLMQEQELAGRLDKIVKS